VNVRAQWDTMSHSNQGTMDQPILRGADRLMREREKQLAHGIFLIVTGSGWD
jgi:hypothetical protein